MEKSNHLHRSLTDVPVYRKQLLKATGVTKSVSTDSFFKLEKGIIEPGKIMTLEGIKEKKRKRKKKNWYKETMKKMINGDSDIDHNAVEKERLRKKMCLQFSSKIDKI